MSGRESAGRTWGEQMPRAGICIAFILGRVGGWAWRGYFWKR